MIFKTEIAGIPCKCEVALYSPDFEYRFLDMNNKPLPWINHKVDKATELRLLEEYKIEEMAQYWGH